ncbi:putative Response regulator containing a CheY-like receiver domain and an HTH DNA-binding domain [Mesorhizobium prunaredense]|uniref:Putative Response regulator containing a CheY-like receiver domain and an HTH DNA-binding domain n=1 Tax=Mesorhizobium prunaredense TaxID=1631249 RepID=A0A1R3VH84_9HYPH|nr:response regulator transcription factor [Mesorhizobium prunaredense]SIT58634.1 putative Response regulator containing a CheY-like receiver domain and an HTH DNA-binding domain [Mesorhizobium prunaredense]
MKTPGPRDPSVSIKVFVLSDVLLYREGLSRQLERDRRVDLIGSGPPLPDILDALAFDGPGVVVMDLSMPDSLAIARRIRERQPDVRVVAFAVSDLSDEVAACARAGVCGYIPKEGTVEDIILSVIHAVRGELYCSPQFAALLLAQVAKSEVAKPALDMAGRLTLREREIIRLMGRSLSNKEIGRTLGISGATVKNHVHNILEKLALRRRSQVPAALSGGYRLTEPGQPPA